MSSKENRRVIDLIKKELHKGSSASSIQRAFRKKKEKRSGLNKLEKEQTKDIIKRGKETIYGRFFTYDVRTTYTANDQQALTAPQNLPGVQNPADGAASCYVLQTGDNLSPASLSLNTTAGMAGCANAMGGYSILQGDTARTMSGNYIYSQSHKLSIKIAMKTIRNQNTIESNYLPTRFRVLYVRAKPHSEVQTASLQGGLFLSEYGQKQGLATPNLTCKFVGKDAIINPGQWTLHKEFNFKLVPYIQPPGIWTDDQDKVRLTQQSTTPYPNEKQLDIWLDHPKKKLKMHDGETVGLNNHEPMNYDFNNYIVIIATTGNPTQNGSLSSSAWTLQASGTSKFKEC